MKLRSAILVGSTLVLLVACNGDDDAAPSAPPVPTASVGSATETSAGPETTPASTSTIPEMTTSDPATTTAAPPSTTATGTVELPPVPTLVPQVPAELLTPEQLDPFNVNNSRPILPEHVPVIEAYLRAAQAFNFVASQDPIDPDAPELLGAPLTAEEIAGNQVGLAARASVGQHLDVSQGVTNRPYVVGPVTETAVLVDCLIAGHYWVDADRQRVDDEIWPAGPGRILEVGLYVEMVQRNGQWLWASSAIDTGACP